MVNWPSTLPQALLRDGLVEQPGDALIASENSTGPAKLRPRSTAVSDTLVGSMLFTDAQKNEFKDFVKNSISRRAKPFNFPNPDGGADLLVRLQTGYAFTLVGLKWKVTLEFEVLP